jgi:hypothetical protein
MKMSVIHVLKINTPTLLLLLLTGIVNQRCVEPSEAESLTFESVIVIEATITNEMKQHQVQLSFSYAFEEERPEPVRGATVLVEDDQGAEYLFEEAAPGTYVSRDAFAAVQGRSYQLKIETNGRSYASESAQLTPLAQMDSLYAERYTNNNGLEGVAIRVDASSPSGNARNYRYTFEESYKIIAPFWAPKILIIPENPDFECRVLTRERFNQGRVCYAIDQSRDIILTNTNDLGQDLVDGFIVRFISRENYIISYRYSILVRQYVQSDAAYTFFETLDSFTGSESIFSETQPGFLEGNVFAEGEAEEKVLGYFDVASVNDQRIFFNYEDFFPGEPLPPYVEPCQIGSPPIAGFGGCILKPIVEADLIRYYGDNTEPPPRGQGPYLTVSKVCGDCTALGREEVPDFWTE